MKWVIDDLELRLVRDLSGKVICYTDNYKISEMIVEDHNKASQHANDCLTEDQKQAIRDERSERRVPRV
jgi:hypothetical protein